MISDEVKNKTLFELSSITDNSENCKAKTGLVCGCFDILHIGHIRLLKFAKSKVDLLIVGLDTDISIQKTKGRNRPINSLPNRMELMAALSIIDFIFPMDFTSTFGKEDSTTYWASMLNTLNPNVLFTCPKSDRFYREKETLTNVLGIEFIPYPKLHRQSTTKIEKTLLAEA